MQRKSELQADIYKVLDAIEFIQDDVRLMERELSDCQDDAQKLEDDLDKAQNERDLFAYLLDEKAAHIERLESAIAALGGNI